MKRMLQISKVAGFIGATAMIAACSGGTTTTDGGTGGTTGGTMAGPPGHGDYYNYVVNSITLPQQSKDFAIDLDANGKTDNQMGTIIGTLTAQMLDAQGGVTDSVNTGAVQILISMQTNDATLKSDSNVGLTMYVGKMTAGTAFDGGCTGCPDFSGAGMFTVDSSITPSVFWGALAANSFSSLNPATTTAPVAMTLNVALLAGSPPLALKLNGVHVSFTTDSKGLMMGQLQGSIKNTDVQSTIIPAVASLLTSKIKSDPMGASTQTLAKLFDVGCTGDATAKAGDGIIAACEVAGNAIIQAVLAPDVKIYDATGAYAPGKGATKDSLSLAVGFTAVKGTFTRP